MAFWWWKLLAWPGWPAGLRRCTMLLILRLCAKGMRLRQPSQTRWEEALMRCWNAARSWKVSTTRLSITRIGCMQWKKQWRTMIQHRVWLQALVTRVVAPTDCDWVRNPRSNLAILFVWRYFVSKFVKANWAKLVAVVDNLISMRQFCMWGLLALPY